MRSLYRECLAPTVCMCVINLMSLDVLDASCLSCGQRPGERRHETSHDHLPPFGRQCTFLTKLWR